MTTFVAFPHSLSQNADDNAMVKPDCCICLCMLEDDVLILMHVTALCLNRINNVCLLACFQLQSSLCNAGLYHTVLSLHHVGTSS